MKKYLFISSMVLILMSSCATQKLEEKKARGIKVSGESTISVGGVCRGNISGDRRGPYLKSVPEAEIYIDGNFIGRAPVKKLKIGSGEHLIEIRAKGYETSSIKLKGISSSWGGWILKDVVATGHKKFSIKSDGLIITLKKQQ